MKPTTATAPMNRLREELHLADNHRWQSYHVFYGGPPRILIQECLAPLSRALIDSNLITEFFYINYWVEGSHVRLRLRVSLDIPEEEVDRIVFTRVRAYLTESPSLHPMTELANNDFYEQLFVGEFTEEDRPRLFDMNGHPIFAANNSIEKRDYEPEWGRYGGPIGMVLSERHFVWSTAQVLDVLDQGNAAVRSLLLGAASLLTFITASALLRDEERIRDFFVAYHQRWIDGYASGADYSEAAGLREHRHTVDRLTTEVVPLLSLVRDGHLKDLPQALVPWAKVNIRTREEIDAAMAGPGLVFDYNDGTRPAESADAAAWSFCHSLIHMTNNRMMVSVADEAFLAFQIARAMGAQP